MTLWGTSFIITFENLDPDDFWNLFQNKGLGYDNSTDSSKHQKLDGECINSLEMTKIILGAGREKCYFIAVLLKFSGTSHSAI